MPGQTIGTALIGQPIRQEVEARSGEDLAIEVLVPGGTSGKIFVSNFRHEQLANPPPGLPSGIVLEGSFTCTVLDSAKVLLSTPTASLLPGRYIYDLAVSNGSATSVSSLREFVLLGSLSAGAGGTALPPVDSVAELISSAIQAHNNSLTAHPGLSSGSASQFELEFSDSSLSSAGYLVLANPLPTIPSSVTVYDEAGETVLPGSILASLSSISVELEDFRPLAGTWRLALSN